MFKMIVAAGSMILLLAASLPGRAGAPEIPSLKSFPSTVGEVVFTHEMHIKDRGIQCVECHHSIRAKKLVSPHPDYFKGASIKCEICHSASNATMPNAYACSACHGTNPMNIADETLSAKVVVHKACWKCHQVGTGPDASKACDKCHSGKKSF